MGKTTLGFVTPLTLAVALNDVLPNPGGVGAAGCVIWSTTTLSLLRWSGTAWVTITETYDLLQSFDGEIIPANRQQIAYGDYEIVGNLELVGELVIL